MARIRITRAALEQKKNPLSLAPHTDPHDFEPVKLSKNVIVRPAPTVADMFEAFKKKKA